MESTSFETLRQFLATVGFDSSVLEDKLHKLLVDIYSSMYESLYTHLPEDKKDEFKTCHEEYKNSPKDKTAYDKVMLELKKLKFFVPNVSELYDIARLKGIQKFATEENLTPEQKETANSFIRDYYSKEPKGKTIYDGFVSSNGLVVK